MVSAVIYSNNQTTTCWLWTQDESTKKTFEIEFAVLHPTIKRIPQKVIHLINVSWARDELRNKPLRIYVSSYDSANIIRRNAFILKQSVNNITYFRTADDGF